MLFAPGNLLVTPGSWFGICGKLFPDRAGLVEGTAFGGLMLGLEFEVGKLGRVVGKEG